MNLDDIERITPTLSPQRLDEPPVTFATPPRFMTAEELMALPDGYGWRFELVAGEAVWFPVGGSAHSDVELGLMMPLGKFVDERELGTVFAPDTGFVLARNPDTVLAPDLSYVSYARLPRSSIDDWYVSSAPEFALEVVAAFEARRLFATKVALYLGAGSRLVWVACPDTETIVAYAPGQAPRLFSRGDSLDGGEVFPGFRISAAEIFDYHKH